LNKIVFGSVLLIALLLVSGCTDQNTTPNSNGSKVTPATSGSNVSGSKSTSSEITFSPPAVLPEAAEGTDYSYSFCKPESIILNGFSCTSHQGRGETTDPTGGLLEEYSFSAKPADSLPEGLGISHNGLFEGTPRSPGTYTFDICVSEDFQVKICKTTSITVTPYKPEVDYNVAVTVDSMVFNACVPGDVHSLDGGWLIVAQGTMTSNIPFDEEPRSVVTNRAPYVQFTMITTSARTGTGREDRMAVYGESMDCGAWKLVESGVGWRYCEKGPGDPNTSPWKVTYSSRTMESEAVSIRAYIESYNPNDFADYVPEGTEYKIHAEAIRSAGTC